jgi:nucleoside-diphosphate-sugar epimerase
MRYCLIGGSGFIGSRLAARLRSAGREFYIFDKVQSARYSDMVTIGDVRDLDCLRSSIIPESVVINLAAEHRDDVRPVALYDEVNVGGAINICQVAREKNIKKIVFTSSVAVYGFAPVGTGEFGEVAPFNNYGRTKYEAEKILKAWQEEASNERTLVIVRPTVVFGEQNRGNVFNLLKQIASGKFIMVGHGENRKSIAYVENVAAFLEFCTVFKPGAYVFNFVDEPAFTMNQLVSIVRQVLGRPDGGKLKLPYAVGYAIGKGCDLAAALTGRRFAISSVRVKKFCANSVYSSRIDSTCFVAPVPLELALKRTIKHEFMEKHNNERLYFSE